MGVYEELQARGLIAQVTNEEEIRKMVNEKGQCYPSALTNRGQPSCRTFHGTLLKSRYSRFI